MTTFGFEQVTLSSSPVLITQPPLSQPWSVPSRGLAQWACSRMYHPQPFSPASQVMEAQGLGRLPSLATTNSCAHELLVMFSTLSMRLARVSLADVGIWKSWMTSPASQSLSAPSLILSQILPTTGFLSPPHSIALNG